MRKINIILILLFLICVSDVFCQSSNQNYIKTRTYRNNSGSQYNDKIDYIDGIGRLTQSVQKNVTPDSKDLVTLQEYDNQGRLKKSWLPVVSMGSGNYVAPSTITSPQAIYGSDTRHYNESVYELSPASRVLETYGPGQTWHQNSKSVKAFVMTNDTSNELKCIRYYTTGIMEDVQLVKNGYFSPNELHVSKIENEDGQATLTFTNKTGQKILIRQINQAETLDTYYVYDISGRLCYVLTPMVGDLLSSTTLSDTENVLKQHAYVFKYNHRDLCTQKRLPGTEWVYYVYDSNDRMIMSQDENIRAKGQWLYHVYDNHNNLIAKSLLNGYHSQSTLQDKYNGGGYNQILYMRYAKDLFNPFENQIFTVQDSLYYAIYGNNQYSIESIEEDLSIDQSMFIAVNSNWRRSEFINRPNVDLQEFMLEHYNSKTTNHNYFLTDFTIDSRYYVGSNDSLSYYCIPDAFTYNIYQDIIYYYHFVFEIIFNPNTIGIHLPSNVMGHGENELRNLDLTLPDDLNFQSVSGVVSAADKATIRQGLLTYEKIKVLESGSKEYTERAYFYNNKNRLIQLVEKNPKGYLTRTSYKYDFVGNVLNKVESITDSSNATTNVQTNYSYDNSGRLLTEQVLVNSALQADLVYAYDQLGRLTTKTYKKGSWSTQETISYNLRGWLTNQSGSYFSMNLNYETPQSPNATQRYSGSISEWAWQQGSGVPQNLYQFDYDGVERLKKTTQFSKSGSAWSPTSAHYVENGITYDKNGNILTLQRTAGGSVVDNLEYTYTGNQLSGLTEQVSSSASNDIFVRGTNALGNYTYDTNGNMITDSRKSLQFEYNLLNLPMNVKSGDVIKAKYVYTADGNKLQVRDGDGTNGYDYVGSFVYKKNDLGIKQELINFSNGVITKVGDSYEVNYFMRDHLGSVRAIVDGTGTLKEQSDYYAFGARQKRSDYLVSENRYRYNGKEVQTTGDLGYLDYGARMYDAGVGRWFANDPLAEKYFSISPFVYCINDPIRLMDPDGRKIKIANNTKGAMENVAKIAATSLGGQVIDHLIGRPETYTMIGTFWTGRSSYDPANRKIRYVENPIYNELPFDGGAVNSTIAMGHESMHAYDHSNSISEKAMRNIEALESNAVSFANNLRESYSLTPLRNKYGSIQGKFHQFSNNGTEKISEFKTIAENSNGTSFGYSYTKTTSELKYNKLGLPTGRKNTRLQKYYMTVSIDGDKNLTYKKYDNEDEYRKATNGW